MRKLKNEAGRTMVEMLGVLAIMGVIMYGAITGIGFGVDMYRVTAAYNDVEELAQTVVDMWSWSRSFNTNGNDLGYVLCNHRAYPSCNTDNAPLGPWSNEISVTSDDGRTFTIAMSLPSKFICNRLKDLEYHNVRLDTNRTDCDSETHAISFIGP